MRVCVCVCICVCVFKQVLPVSVIMSTDTVYLPYTEPYDGPPPPPPPHYETGHALAAIIALTIGLSGVLAFLWVNVSAKMHAVHTHMHPRTGAPKRLALCGCRVLHATRSKSHVRVCVCVCVCSTLVRRTQSVRRCWQPYNKQS